MEAKKAWDLKPPPTAHHWSLWKLRTERPPGQRPKGRQDRCQGTPNEDGSIPETWPIETFSARNVLEGWGPGRYRVEFFDSSDSVVARKSFAVDNPRTGKATAPRTRRTAEQDDDDTDTVVSSVRGGGSTKVKRGDRISAWEVMALIDQREQAAAERYRQDAQIAQQRDRDFFNNMLTLIAQQRTAPTMDIDLIRREMRLSINENMFQIRRELGSQQEAEEPDTEEDLDDRPKDIGEAGTRIMMSLLGELEQKAPALIDEAIPMIAKALQRRGFEPSDRLKHAIDQAQQLRARAQNGAGGADGS